MKAQSYGSYDVFDNETALTWQEAEALALKARGQKPPKPEEPPKQRKRERAPEIQEQERPKPVSATLRQLLESKEPELSEERQLLNRALILLIHLRERVFTEHPEVATWVNEILSAAKGKAE